MDQEKQYDFDNPVFFIDHTDDTEPEIVSVDPPNVSPTHMSTYYNNIRGMTGKRDHILLSSSSTDYDVIMLTETWLSETKFSAEFFDPKFTVYRKDRHSSMIQEEKGGGVLIAINSKYDSEIISIGELESLEAICVKIALRSSNTRMFNLGSKFARRSG